VTLSLVDLLAGGGARRSKRTYNGWRIYPYLHIISQVNGECTHHKHTCTHTHTHTHTHMNGQMARHPPSASLGASFRGAHYFHADVGNWGRGQSWSRCLDKVIKCDAN